MSQSTGKCDVAKCRERAVIYTGNKDEPTFGYCAKHHDASCDGKPLKMRRH